MLVQQRRIPVALGVALLLVCVLILGYTTITPQNDSTLKPTIRSTFAKADDGSDNIHKQDKSGDTAPRTYTAADKAQMEQRLRYYMSLDTALKSPPFPTVSDMQEYYSNVILIVMTSPVREHLVLDIRQHYSTFFKHIVFVRGGGGETVVNASDNTHLKPPFDVIYQAERSPMGAVVGKPKRWRESQSQRLDTLWIERKNRNNTNSNRSKSTTTAHADNNNSVYSERIVGVVTPRDKARDPSMVGAGWYGVGFMQYVATAEIMGRVELLKLLMTSSILQSEDFDSDWMRAFAPWLFPPSLQPSLWESPSALPDIEGALFLGDDMIFMPWEPLRRNFNKKVPWLSEIGVVERPYDPRRPLESPQTLWATHSQYAKPLADKPLMPFDEPDPFANPMMQKQCRAPSKRNKNLKEDNCRISLEEAHTLMRHWARRTIPYRVKLPMRKGDQRPRTAVVSGLHTAPPRGMGEPSLASLARSYSSLRWFYSNASTDDSGSSTQHVVDDSSHGQFPPAWNEAHINSMAKSVAIILDRYFPRDYTSIQPNSTNNPIAYATLSRARFVAGVQKDSSPGADNFLNKINANAMDSTCIVEAEAMGMPLNVGGTDRSPSVKADLLPQYLKVMLNGPSNDWETKQFLPPFSRRAIIAATRRLPLYTFAEGSNIPFAVGTNEYPKAFVDIAYKIYGNKQSTPPSGSNARYKNKYKILSDARAAAATYLGIVDAYYVPRHSFPAFAWLAHASSHCDGFIELTIPTISYLIQIAYARRLEEQFAHADTDDILAEFEDSSATTASSESSPKAAENLSKTHLDYYERLDAQYYWEGLAMDCTRELYFVCPDTELGEIYIGNSETQNAEEEAFKFNARFRADGPYLRLGVAGIHRCRHDHAFVRRLFGSTTEQPYLNASSRTNPLWENLCTNRSLLAAIRDIPPARMDNQGFNKDPPSQRWIIPSPWQRGVNNEDIDHRMFWKKKKAVDEGSDEQDNEPGIVIEETPKKRKSFELVK